MKASHSFPNPIGLFNHTRSSAAIRPKNHPRLNHVVEKISQFMGQFTSGSELKIWHKTDSLGQSTWFVFDARTSSSQVFSSEQAVRDWLEQRYSA